MKSYRSYKMIWFFLFLLLVNGCATSNSSRQTTPSDSPPKTLKVSVIQNVSFVEEENSTRIRLEGSEILDSPFYKLLSDPLRIAIDVPNIDLRRIKEPVRIGNGTVSEVLTTQFDDKGRIEIGLLQMTNYNVFKEDKNLIIDIEKVKKIAEVKEASKQEVKQEEEVKDRRSEITPSELKGEEIPPIKPLETGPPPETLQKAKQIVNLSFDKKKDSITFNLVGDGKIGNYNAFKLDSPPRLVLDIWEMDTRFPKDPIKIQDQLIKKVRIGRHPDKLRFVFESLTPQLPPYQVTRSGDKLMISFGSVPQPSEPQIVLAEKTTGLVPSKRAQIRAPIEFKQVDDVSRIVVSLTEEPQFESRTVSKKVVAVDIKNAFLPAHLQKGMDTSEFDSAVQYIDLKNIKAGKASDVRILIKLKEEVRVDTTKEGKTLFIDVERPKKIEAKTEVMPEAKKEEVVLESKKGEAKEEKDKKIMDSQKEEVQKEREKTVLELKRPDKALATIEEKAPVQPQGFKRAQGAKKVVEEAPPEMVYTGRKLSLDFKDADIKNILRLIAEVSNFNIIAGDEVTGKITMRLVDVPWDQALDLILQARSLGMSKMGNVIRIAPLESLKKEIQVELESKRSKEKLEDLVTELIPVNYATGKEILPQVKGILSDRGDIKVDDRTNILIIKDIPRNIAAAKNLVKSLDTKTPQVMIEARIVEANMNFQRVLGISWGFLTHEGPDKGRQTSVGGGTAGASTLRDPIGTPSVSTRKLVDLPAIGGSILEFLFTSDSGLKSLDVAISAGEEQGDVKIISSPKIATLDNKEASVEQGLRIPYLKLTTEGTVTTDFIDANLKLTVTPHVTNDGQIKMKIDTKKDAPDTSITVQGVPSIDKKQAITEVMIRDGGVVTIAGIYTIEKNNTSSGVPLLSKIPVLGWLFKAESKEDTRKDLLIFISPRIIKDQPT
jgi:type IV pilus assembly protein PilQ